MAMNRSGFRSPHHQGGWVALPWIGVGLAAVGTFMSYKGQKAAGKAEEQRQQREEARGRELEKLGEFEAQQLEQNALTTVAASQRTASEERRQSDLIQSRALALAAASGGGASDPTVTRVISELAGIGSYRSAVALYEGEENARQMRLGAVARRQEGRLGLQAGGSAQKAYNTLATGSLLTGAGRIGVSLYEKYGGKGPSTQTTNPPTDTSYIDAGTPGFSPYA